MTSLSSARPRLEPATLRTGPVPFYRLAGPGADLPPQAPPQPEPAGLPADAQLAALYRQLATFRSECHAAFRARETQLCVVPHADIDWLNHELAVVRALNAALPRQFRAQRVAHWPSPPFLPRRLYSVRDLLPALDLALRVVETSAGRRRLELADG